MIDETQENEKDEVKPRRGRPRGQKNQPGHGAGRPPLGDPDDPTERHTMTAKHSQWAVILEIGDGYYSLGLQRLVDMFVQMRDMGNS